MAKDGPSPIETPEPEKTGGRLKKSPIFHPFQGMRGPPEAFTIQLNWITESNNHF